MSRLLVELVPSSSWGDNLRSLLSRKDWDLLRRESYALAGNRCEVCGGRGRRHSVECHERWIYDDTNHVQKLLGLEALCPSCHQVRHLGFAFARGRERQAIVHLIKVNGWGSQQTSEHIAEVFRVHAERSRFPWELDLSWLETKGVALKGH